MNTSASDVDAIVVGGGHNGLVTAAYLARAGLQTTLIEARSSVGGTASSETFGGATVNICNCDHLTFRTTPIAQELSLADHGLIYDDIEPAQYLGSWADDTVIAQSHSLDATLDAIGTRLPTEVDGYRRYARTAMPVVESILEAALEPPTVRGLARIALRRRLHGLITLLGWSRRSAADVLRSYFDHDALAATGAIGGPMVWGTSPEFPGTGLGALPHALKHVAAVGRPRGGSGALTDAIAAAFTAAGGTIMLETTVASIDCEHGRVRGVGCADGTEITAPIVVSAVDPTRTFVRWLRNPPATALAAIQRWRSVPRQQGYESKIDAIVTDPPVLRGLDDPTASTALIAPSLHEIHRGYTLMQRGEILPQPALLMNVPTVADPSMAPPANPDQHVLSLEVLYTPYSLRGGWSATVEPERWLELLQTKCEPGLRESIVEMRAMTPDAYERDFHLPAGHATSFAGGPLAVFTTSEPELTSYQSTVEGLYLTGAATFPGAGVWGASGRNCAGVVLERARS